MQPISIVPKYLIWLMTLHAAAVGAQVACVAAEDPRPLVRLTGEPVEMRFAGVEFSDQPQLRFASDERRLIVDPAGVVRFGSRAAPQGGTVVALVDGSCIACTRAELVASEIKILGGLFSHALVPRELVKYIVRRFPYDIAAGDRLQQQLEQLAGAEDLVLTVAGDVQRGIIRNPPEAAAVTIGRDDLNWFDGEGGERTTNARSVRAIVFGGVERPRSVPIPASDTFEVGWNDGSFLAGATINDSFRIQSGLVDSLAWWAEQGRALPLCYLAGKSEQLAGPKSELLVERRVTRYRAQSPLWGAESPIAAWRAAAQRPGINETLSGLPPRIDGRQYPNVIAPHPVSTLIYLVPPEQTFRGSVAQLDYSYTATGDPVAAHGDGNTFEVIVSAGASSASIDPLYQSGPIAAGAAPVPLEIPLGAARILVLEFRSQSPTVYPALLDGRLEPR